MSGPFARTMDGRKSIRMMSITLLLALVVTMLFTGTAQAGLVTVLDNTLYEVMIDAPQGSFEGPGNEIPYSGRGRMIDANGDEFAVPACQLKWVITTRAYDGLGSGPFAIEQSVVTCETNPDTNVGVFTVPNLPAGHLEVEFELQALDESRTNVMDSVSRSIFSSNRLDDAHDTVGIVSGANEAFGYALTTGAAVARLSGSLLLTERDGLNPEAMAGLKGISTVVLSGDAAYVDSPLRQELDAMVQANQLGQVIAFSGDDRQVSAGLSGFGFDGEHCFTTAYLATNANYADALSVAPLAGRLGLQPGPVLLTDPSGVSAEVQAELTRCNPQRVVIAGGTAAVSADTEAALRALLPASAIERLAGATRFETSALAAGYMPPSADVVLATAYNPADALTAATLAAAFTAPVLLTEAGDLPTASATVVFDRQPTRAFIIGGTAAVSEAVADDIRAAWYPANVVRLGGATRYQTAAAVDNYFRYGVTP